MAIGEKIGPGEALTVRSAGIEVLENVGIIVSDGTTEALTVGNAEKEVSENVETTVSDGTTEALTVGSTALIVGVMVKLLGKKVWVYAVSMFLGIAACYAFGTAWFVVYNNHNSADATTIGAALSMCVVPFIIPDLVKIAVATLLCKRLAKHVKA